MKRALFTIIMGLALLFAGSANAQPTASTPQPVVANPAACARACGAQYNMCLSREPDFKGKCSALPECQGVTDGQFDEYQAWFSACIDNPSLQCPQSCVPTQVTPPSPPTGTTPTTTPPQVRHNQPPAMSYKRRCELKGGLYSKTVTVDAHGARTTIEECLMYRDALKRIEDLERRVTALEQGKSPTTNVDLTELIKQLTQIRDGVNTANGKMDEVRTRADKIISQYNALVERVNDLERGQQTNTRDIAGIKGRLAQIPSGSQNDVRGTGLRPEALPGEYEVRGRGLPCWLAGYGELHLNKNFDYFQGSEGLELGCRLFGSRDLGFVAGVGGGYANRFYDHHMVEVHTAFGLNAALGPQTDLLLMAAGKSFRTTTFENGTSNWYGLLPEIRYTFNPANPWFIGARLGLGVTNAAPPRPEEMGNQRAAHFDENAWLLLGYEFGREPAKPRQNTVALPVYGNPEVKNEVDDNATVTVTSP
ncbi:MAG: hypothetical protein PHS79_03015 [Patescibacteria group bacterium]|nr:hypothetical protein [Patescibacteria group bacterium]